MKYIKNSKNSDISKIKIHRNYKSGDIVTIINNNDIGKVAYKSGRTYIIYALTFKNGVYDLPAGKIRKSTPEEIEEYEIKKNVNNYNL